MGNSCHGNIYPAGTFLPRHKMSARLRGSARLGPRADMNSSSHHHDRMSARAAVTVGVREATAVSCYQIHYKIATFMRSCSFPTSRSWGA